MSDTESFEQPPADVAEPANAEAPLPKPPGVNGEQPETISDKIRSAREAIPVGDRGLTPTAYEHQVTIAKDRARAYLMLPEHLHNNAPVMAALVGIAARFNLDPIMLASQTYIQNNRLCFQAQAFGAILYGSGLLIGRLRFDFKGEGEDMTCTVFGRFKDDPDTICGATTPPLKLIHPGHVTKEGKGTFVKGSPLWDKDPEQQMAYFAERRWIRRFAPDACMGMYTADEIAEIDSFRIARGDSVPLTSDRLGQLETGEGWNDGSHVDLDLAAIKPEQPDPEPEPPPKDTRRTASQPREKATYARKPVARPRTAPPPKPPPGRPKTPPPKATPRGRAPAPPTKAMVDAAVRRAESGQRVVSRLSEPPKWLNYVGATEAWIAAVASPEAAQAADDRWGNEREQRDRLYVPMGERSRLRALLDRKIKQHRKPTA